MCGVFGISNNKNASELTYLGLYALQHRGQESAGIVSCDESKFYSKIGQGEVQEVFDRESLSKLVGINAIGHVRYSTYGTSELKNAQPIIVKCSKGILALAHNGNIVNARYLRNKLESQGAIFQTNTDSEVILHLIAHSKEKNLLESIRKVFYKVKGSYSLLLMTPTTIYAIRDPYGFRPLVLGKLSRSYIITSETCALDIIEAEFCREINPGEILEIKNGNIKSYNLINKNFDFKVDERLCIFEYIYFSRPDSILKNNSVHRIRQELGKYLYKELPTSADLVIPVPDSAISAALGYSSISGIPFDTGFIRNHYVGRTFIQPKQRIRDFSAKIKYNTVKDVIKNKRIIVVDDSIVRGTTSKKLIKMLRCSGAKEIHLRITSSPIISSCIYGIDTPTKKELIAYNYKVNEIKNFLNVDSLHYLSIDGMVAATQIKKSCLCLACFNKNYPVK